MDEKFLGGELNRALAADGLLAYCRL